MNEENKRYNPRGGAIHPEDTKPERDRVSEDKNTGLEHEKLLQKIEAINSQKRLLIEEMNDLVDRQTERGDFKGKRIEILEKLSALDRELEGLEGLSKPFENGEPTLISESVLYQQRKRKLLKPQSEQLKPPKISQEITKDITAINSPPKVEKKYQSEHVGTTFHNDTPDVVTEPVPVRIEPDFIMQDTPIKSINWIAVIILLIIISSSLYFVIGNSNSQNTKHVTPSNFSNNNAEKVTNPLPTPKDSFDKINEYREQNKKYRILWSDDAYRLADFRASDMVKRNYFSHTTPDGKTVSDYIGKYNFYSDSAWGENMCKGCPDPTQTWIGSAGHREVLLGGWGKGAVACESDICVFIGVNE